MRKKWLTILIILLVILSVFFLINTKMQKRPEMNIIKTIQVIEEPITSSLASEGRVKTLLSRSINSETIADVISIEKKLGDSVKAGDIIIKLDSTDLETSLLQAKYQLALDEDSLNDLVTVGDSVKKLSYERAKLSYENTKKSYDDTKKLYDAGLSSISELSQLEVSLKGAQIDLKNAQDSLVTGSSSSQLSILNLKIEMDRKNIESIEKQKEACTVISPIDGVVTSIIDSNTVSVSTGMNLVTIEDLNNLIVESTISEYDSSRVLLGQEVNIKNVSDDNTIIKGTVFEKSPSAQISGTDIIVPIKISVLDKSTSLMPNSTVNMDIIASKVDKALVIPYDALTEEGDKYYVLLNKANIPTKVYVQKGIENAAKVQIISDEIKIGDLIIMPTMDVIDSNLNTGMQVRKVL